MITRKIVKRFSSKTHHVAFKLICSSTFRIWKKKNSPQHKFLKVLKYILLVNNLNNQFITFCNLIIINKYRSFFDLFLIFAFWNFNSLFNVSIRSVLVHLSFFKIWQFFSWILRTFSMELVDFSNLFQSIHQTHSTINRKILIIFWMLNNWINYLSNLDFLDFRSFCYLSQSLLFST